MDLYSPVDSYNVGSGTNYSTTIHKSYFYSLSIDSDEEGDINRVRAILNSKSNVSAKETKDEVLKGLLTNKHARESRPEIKRPGIVCNATHLIHRHIGFEEQKQFSYISEPNNGNGIHVEKLNPTEVEQNLDVNDTDKKDFGDSACTEKIYRPTIESNESSKDGVYIPEVRRIEEVTQLKAIIDTRQIIDNFEVHEEHFVKLSVEQDDEDAIMSLIDPGHPKAKSASHELSVVTLTVTNGDSRTVEPQSSGDRTKCQNDIDQNLASDKSNGIVIQMTGARGKVTDLPPPPLPVMTKVITEGSYEPNPGPMDGVLAETIELPAHCVTTSLDCTMTSPNDPMTSPDYVVTSSNYSVASRDCAMTPSDCAMTSPNYTMTSPNCAMTSPHCAIISPKSKDINPIEIKKHTVDINDICTDPLHSLPDSSGVTGLLTGPSTDPFKHKAYFLDCSVDSDDEFDLSLLQRNTDTVAMYNQVSLQEFSVVPTSTQNDASNVLLASENKNESYKIPSQDIDDVTNVSTTPDINNGSNVIPTHINGENDEIPLLDINDRCISNFIPTPDTENVSNAITASNITEVLNAIPTSDTEVVSKATPTPDTEVSNYILMLNITGTINDIPSPVANDVSTIISTSDTTHGPMHESKGISTFDSCLVSLQGSLNHKSLPAKPASAKAECIQEGNTNESAHPLGAFNAITQYLPNDRLPWKIVEDSTLEPSSLYFERKIIKSTHDDAPFNGNNIDTNFSNSKLKQDTERCPADYIPDARETCVMDITLKQPQDTMLSVDITNITNRDLCDESSSSWWTKTTEISSTDFSDTVKDHKHNFVEKHYFLECGVESDDEEVCSHAIDLIRKSHEEETLGIKEDTPLETKHEPNLEMKEERASTEEQVGLPKKRPTSEQEGLTQKEEQTPKDGPTFREEPKQKEKSILETKEGPAPTEEQTSKEEPTPKKKPTLETKQGPTPTDEQTSKVEPTTKKEPTLERIEDPTPTEEQTSKDEPTTEKESILERIEGPTPTEKQTPKKEPTTKKEPTVETNEEPTQKEASKLEAKDEYICISIMKSTKTIPMDTYPNDMRTTHIETAMKLNGQNCLKMSEDFKALTTVSDHDSSVKPKAAIPDIPHKSYFIQSSIESDDEECLNVFENIITSRNCAISSSNTKDEINPMKGKGKRFTFETKEDLILEAKVESTLVAKDESTFVTKEEATLVAKEELIIDGKEESTFDAKEESTLVAKEETTLETKEESTLVVKEELTLDAKEESI